MFQNRSMSTDKPDLYAYKTADQSVVDSITVVDDDDLIVDVASGRKYIIRLTMFTTTDAGGIRVGFGGTVVPVESGNWMLGGYDVRWQGASANEISPTSFANGLWGDPILVDNENDMDLVELYGFVEVVTGGTLIVQWALEDNPVGVNTATVRRGSSLQLWRMS